MTEQSRLRADEARRQAAIAIGAEVERFVETPLGMALLDQVGKWRQHQLEKMAKTPVRDTDALIELQNDVKLADNFAIWLKGMLDAAAKAMHDAELDKLDNDTL